MTCAACGIDLSGPRTPANPSHLGLAIDPRGRWVALLLGSQVELHDTRSPRKFVFVPTTGLEVTSALPLDDMPTVAAAVTTTRGSELVIFEGPNGRVSQHHRVAGGITDLTTGPDAQLIVATTRGLHLWDRSEGSTRSFMHRHHIVSAVLAPDSQHVVAIGRRQRTCKVFVLSLRHGIARTLGEVPAFHDSACLALSPSGRWLALDADSSGIVVADLTTRTTSELPISVATAVLFDGDQRLIVASGGACTGTKANAEICLPGLQLERTTRLIPTSDSISAMRMIDGRMLASTHFESYWVDLDRFEAEPTSHRSDNPARLCG